MTEVLLLSIIINWRARGISEWATHANQYECHDVRDAVLITDHHEQHKITY